MSAEFVLCSFADALAAARSHAAGLSVHSGKISRGDIFVSLPRAVPAGPDGPDYSGAETHVLQAVAAGAGRIVCTRPVWDGVRCAIDAVPASSPVGALRVAFVDDARDALGQLAAAYYATDASAVTLLAITGTNGKTTSTYLLEAILRRAGLTPGVIGTVEYRWPGHREESPLTTPGILALHEMVAAMGAAGADAGILEVSSHAIEQNRVAGLRFSGGLFTNLTQDHLDYHGNMEDYFNVKARLFEENNPFMTDSPALAANIDDAHGMRLFDANPAVLGYGLGGPRGRVVSGEILEQGRDGLHLRMTYSGMSWELASPLVGEFNAYNLLGAQALALALGVETRHMRALADFCGVPGRLERVPNSRDLSVFVDYAHTPDALRKALQALRGAKFSRIITVFGCGGDRDRAKRPLMGRAAAQLSDVAVLTSDNPRTEDPLRIMADVKPGLAGAGKVVEEADRRKAIGLALEELRPGDALLIAGKGHEPYQVIGTTKYPFSDRDVVREYLGCA